MCLDTSGKEILVFGHSRILSSTSIVSYKSLAHMCCIVATKNIIQPKHLGRGKPRSV